MVGQGENGVNESRGEVCPLENLYGSTGEKAEGKSSGNRRGDLPVRNYVRRIEALRMQARQK